MENCTAEYISNTDYGGKYYCGPDGKQTEVRVIERDSREQVLWSYVVRPQSIMCKSNHLDLPVLPHHGSNFGGLVLGLACINGRV